jgi:hypothetical protein
MSASLAEGPVLWLIQAPLAMKLLDGEILPGDTAVADVDPKSHEVLFTKKVAPVEELASST